MTRRHAAHRRQPSPPAGNGSKRQSRSDPYCWLIANARFAMVRVPLRGAPVPLGSTANCTFPEPEPDAPSVIVIHAAPLTALHGHPPAVETETVPTPPDPGMVTDVALRLNVQPLSCMTVTVRAATVTVPLRAGPVLAATESERAVAAAAGGPGDADPSRVTDGCPRAGRRGRDFDARAAAGRRRRHCLR